MIAGCHHRLRRMMTPRRSCFTQLTVNHCLRAISERDREGDSVLMETLPAPCPGRIHGCEARWFCTASRAADWYTPNAICVLQFGCTVPLYLYEKRTISGTTPVALCCMKTQQSRSQSVINRRDGVAPNGTTRCTGKTSETKLKIRARGAAPGWREGNYAGVRPDHRVAVSVNK